MKRAAGFTLVELLLAVCVMGLMAAVGWRGLDGMTRTLDAVDRRADAVLTLQAGLAQWGADLDALVLLPETAAFDWNGRVLRLTRRGAQPAPAGVRVVAWTRRDGTWLRWQSPPLATRSDVDGAWDQAERWSQNPGEAQRHDEVAVLPLQDWQLYFFRGDSWSNPLSSAATASQAFGSRGNDMPIPDGVRLVLVMPPGQALAGRVVRDWASPKLGRAKS
jgi:general secretion pathway protein J